MAMPNYVSPTWVDNSAPKLNAANLQALTDCVERSQLLHGSGAPTTSTAGDVGQRYRDDTTGIVYVCKSESSGTYTWEPETDHDGLTDEIKQALLQLAAKVAYIDADGQDYYDDLYDALYPNMYWTVTNTLTNCSTSNDAVQTLKDGAYTATITASSGYTLTGATVSVTMGGTDITSTAYSNGTISIASVTGDLVIAITAAAKTLSSISAVYTQSGTVYNTDSLDSLKSDLVVTATYSDSSTATVPSADYTLSGTLTVGTSTITVSYGGKTTTFTVTVTESQAIVIDLTQDLQQGQIQQKYPYISTSTSGQPTYSTNHNNRVSYVGVAIEGNAQHRYTVNYTTSITGSTNIGVQYVTDKAKVNNHEDLTDNTNKFSLGWQNDGFKFVPPTDCYIWLTFRAGSGSTAVVPSDFTSVTITVEEITAGMIWYNWDLTQSLVDTIESREIVLNSATGVPNATQSSSGLSFDAATQIAYLGRISPAGKTFEIDVSSFDFVGDDSHHVRFFMNANSDASTSYGNGALIYRSGYGWAPYGFKNQSGTNTRQWGSVYDSSLGVNAINGKTVKIVFSNDGITKSVYLDNDLIGTNNTIHFDGSGNMSAEYTFVGGINTLSQADGDQCYNMTITGIRVYQNT